jgi:phosphoadenosine phosphosulfate reductase
MSQLNASEIALLAREFAGRKVEEILEWAVSAFTPRLAMTSNFGVEGVVVMDHLRRIAPDVPIIYIETGYQFAETDRLKEELRARLGVNIIRFTANASTRAIRISVVACGKSSR